MITIVIRANSQQQISTVVTDQVGNYSNSTAADLHNRQNEGVLLAGRLFPMFLLLRCIRRVMMVFIQSVIHEDALS